MRSLRSSLSPGAADLSLRQLIIGIVRADSCRPLRLKMVPRNIWFVLCLMSALTWFAQKVSAQPETFEGNPDSSAFIRIPSDTDDWTRHFRIGALVGLNISANFSRSGTFDISGNDPSSGIFDDGYVRVDNTGNLGGGTTYWGYRRASQLNGSELTMTAASSFSTTSSSKESGVFPGFDMAYGDNLWYWKHARVGWELGFDLLPVSITENQSAPATVTQFAYVYNVGSVTIPQAPYSGNPSGSSAMIPDTASITNESFQTGTVNGKQTLDVMLYTLRLGPTFYWDLSEHVSLSLGAGPVVGLVSGDYKYDETITAGGINDAHNSGKIGGTDLIYGGYVNATVLCHVTDNGDIYAGVQYMPMSNATISGGGREGRLNLGGQVYFTIGVNWPF